MHARIDSQKKVSFLAPVLQQNRFTNFMASLVNYLYGNCSFANALHLQCNNIILVLKESFVIRCIMHFTYPYKCNFCMVVRKRNEIYVYQNNVFGVFDNFREEDCMCKEEKWRYLTCISYHQYFKSVLLLYFSIKINNDLIKRTTYVSSPPPCI